MSRIHFTYVKLSLSFFKIDNEIYFLIFNKMSGNKKFISAHICHNCGFVYIDLCSRVKCMLCKSYNVKWYDSITPKIEKWRINTYG